MGELNKIYNSLKVISEGSSFNYTGFTVCDSGDTTSAAGTTSFIVRDGGHVGVNTSAPDNGWGGAFGGFPHHPNLHVDGYARITGLPSVKGMYLAADTKGNIGWTSGPGIPLTGDTYAVSAYTSGCTLFITTNAGTVLTADTCSQFDASPYEYKLAQGSIGPKLPVWGSAAENYINVDSKWSNIQGGYQNRIEMLGPGAGSFCGILSGYRNEIGITNAGAQDWGGYHVLGGGANNHIDGNDTWYNSLFGGNFNGITGTSYSYIGGGTSNKILQAGNGVIVGGQSNRLLNASFAIVGGGYQNVIDPSGDYGGIFNGSGNTINNNFSAAIGSVGRISTSSHYTYVQGLDADTDSADGPKPFRYHGVFANQGANNVLIDVDGTGNAKWWPTGGIALTGDCVAISAYTTGATLFILTGPPCNQILTADTGSYISGPYEYGGAAQAIQPILGANTSDAVASSIQGGIVNIIAPEAAFVGIGTGNNNFVNHATNSHITSGAGNRIGIDSACPPGVNCINTLTNIVGGNSSIISAASRSTIVGGYVNQLIDIDYATILGGAQNWINSSTKGNDSYSLIGQGFNNLVQQTSTTKPQYATILNGNTNIIRPLSNYATINGGLNNTISASSFSQILMGWDNVISNNISISDQYMGQNTILNGENSSIRGGNYQHILGGLTNRIYNAVFSHVVGGSGNTISSGAKGSAIIGGLGITATKPQTTYTKGLDTNTDTSSGGQYFKYYGALAKPGINRVLTDIDGAGNAEWTDLPFNPGITGGTGVIVSATSSGCTAYFWTTTGNVFTADTCNSFTPYRFGQAPNSIRPVFPSGPVTQNRIDPISTESVISGGRMNRISGSTLSNISGGRNNVIDMRGTGAFWNSILGGNGNMIYVRPASVGPHFQNAIVHGDQNRISGGARNMVVQGFKNNLTETYASILNGAYNSVGHRSSVIMGGEHIHSYTSHTVSMRGLNVNTDIQEAQVGPTNANQRPFRYNGAFAIEPGMDPTGYYLRSWNAEGDAYWDRGETVPMGPDNYALSAYTTGCTLHVTVSNGTILTANTCNGEFSTSPYRYGGGVDSITPVLPAFPTSGFHEILPDDSYSSIQNGFDNRIDTGDDAAGANSIMGSAYSLIQSTITAGTISYCNSLVAASNVVLSGSVTTLITGEGNTANDVGHSAIIGGTGNSVITAQSSGIFAGQYNNISLVVNPKGGTYWPGNTIIGGAQNEILSSTTISSIVGGLSNRLDTCGTSNLIASSYFSNITRNNLLGHCSSTSTILGATTSTIYGASSAHINASYNARIGQADGSNTVIRDEEGNYSAMIGIHGPSTSFIGHNNPNMMSGTTMVTRLKVTGGMYENTTILDSLESGLNYHMTPLDHHIVYIKDDGATSYVYLPGQSRGGLRAGRKISFRIVKTPTGTGEVQVHVASTIYEAIAGCTSSIEGIGSGSVWTGMVEFVVMGGETGMCSMEFIAYPTQQLSELTYPQGVPNQQPLPNGGTQKYIWFYTNHEQFK